MEKGCIPGGWNSRKIWRMRFGPIPDGMYVCHMCDNTNCANHEHMFLGTPQENMLDKERKGRGNHTGRKPGYWWRHR